MQTSFIREQWMYLFPLIIALICLLSITDLQASTKRPETFRLSYLPPSKSGADCDMHPGQSGAKNSTIRKKSGRPASVLESEHRPLPKRAYAIKGIDRRSLLEAYVRRPDGSVTVPQLRQGYNSMVTFSTPLDDPAVHGANSVYVVEKGVKENVLQVKTAKWITMHHSCRWGHDQKFDPEYTIPQPLESIPVEINVDRLWDTNFHLGVSSGDTLAITVLSFGRPVTEADVAVTSEKGWTIRGTTGDDGTVAIQMIRDYYPSAWKTFKRNHRGEFLVTASFSRMEQGIHNDNKYDSIHYFASLPWQYKLSLRDYGSYPYGLLLVVTGMSVSGLGVFFYRERRKKRYRKIEFDE